MTEEKTVRLNRRLSMAGVCSRREADRLIDEGRVTVDGRPAMQGMTVSLRQKVCLDGKPLPTQQKERILAVYKPRGVVCSTDRRWGDTLLEDLVNVPERVFYMGRLDKDSEGLILMTNRGELADGIMRARNRHEKEYVVDTDREIDTAFLKNMEKGVWLEELQVTTRPCRAWQTGPHRFHIILTQGLNRQIRRMCGALGYRVIGLKRIRIMQIGLGTMKPGTWRELTDEEREGLMAASGVRGDAPSGKETEFVNGCEPLAAKHALTNSCPSTLSQSAILRFGRRTDGQTVKS